MSNTALRPAMFSRQTMIVGDLSNVRATVVGCGGVGSNTAMTLASMGVGTFYLYDFDEVEIENVGPQAYSMDDVGLRKTEALARKLMSFGAEVVAIDEEVTEETAFPESELFVVGLDSLPGRRDVFSAWRNGESKDSTLLYMDARMGGTGCNVFTFSPADGGAQAEDDYWTTLQPEPRTSLPCGMKATAFITKGIIPGVIGTNVRNFFKQDPIMPFFAFDAEGGAMFYTGK